MQAIKIREDRGISGLLTERNPPSVTSADSDLLEFSVVRTFNFLSSEFAELYERADATAFQNPIWLDCAFRWLASPYPAEILIGRTRADGKLVVLLPMIRRQLGLVSLRDGADLNVSDYSALVVDQRVAGIPAVVDQIMAALRDLTFVRVRRVRDLNIGFPLPESER